LKQHTELINKFYSCFQKKDYTGMIECYHPNIQFKDELFSLNGKQASAMWHMLCERGKDLEISFRDIEATEDGGSAHWEAEYTFSQTKRKVHNKIYAKFEFRDGKIIQHTDAFNFWKWSGQALGLPGIILGWSSILKKKVSKEVNTYLNKFIETHPEYR
jgi:ketosteroid isomerase-like protein